MCLKLNEPTKIKRAENDIVCYKVIEEITTFNDWLGLWNTMYLTPCWSKQVPKPVIAGNRDFTPDYVLCQSTFSKEVNGGFIHTYQFLTGAIALREKLLDEYEDFRRKDKKQINYSIYECVIPKNTKYLEGGDQLTFCNAYASTAIRFVKKLELE